MCYFGPMVNYSNLHYETLKHVIDKGHAPENHYLAERLNATEQEIEKGLKALQDYHGIVLHPNEPKVWAIHPFSMAPTNFLVESRRGKWWGNCAWCSLGIAALLNEDLTIKTSLGAHGDPITIHLRDGKITERDLLIHFPIPMKNAWDNVIYTCSTMLIFEDEKQIDLWCERHNITKGDVQPINHIWEFSKKWYGNHLDPEWRKWTKKEATSIFREFDLTHNIWSLESDQGRF